VDESLDADLVVRIALFPSEASGTAEVLLKDAAGSIVTGQDNVQIDGGAARTVFHFKKGEVKLWYPVGYGEQPLYDVEVKVFDDVRSSITGKELLHSEVILFQQSQLLDAKMQKIGFRRARVVEDKLVDRPGLTWLFEINNIRIFCGGSNWIPADSFLTT
jgi:beta-mannosidase